MAMSLLKLKIREFGAKYRDILFPERLLRGTSWENAWYEEHRARTIKVSKYFLISSAILWLSHHWLYDLPHNLQPYNLWLGFRLVTFGTGMIAGLLCFWPRLVRSKYYWAPLAVTGAVYSIGEANAMRWTDAIHLILPGIFIFFHTFILRFNVFWSVLYASLVFAAAYPAMVATNDISSVWSCILTIMICTYFTRATARADISAFLNVRQLAESRQKEAEAKEAMLKKELELSGAVQSLLLPAGDSLEDQRFALAGRSVSANQCGGDWWWYHHHNDKIRVMVADVTGHGAGPAMVTASVSSFTKVLYSPQKPFSELLTQLQAHYFDYFVNSKYWMTLTGCEIDLKTMKVSVWFAGSPPVFCIDKSGEVNILSETGPPFGCEPAPFGYAEHTLPEGGKVIITTDGMIETRRKKSGSEIGLKRVLSTFEKMHTLPANDLMNKFFKYVETERGENPQDDDYTFIVVDLSRPKAQKLSA